MEVEIRPGICSAQRVSGETDGATILVTFVADLDGESNARDFVPDFSAVSATVVAAAVDCSVRRDAVVVASVASAVVAVVDVVVSVTTTPQRLYR
mmetsp:Transcript_1289/g.3025  ORF Transcript_1289/g.3025 Transcript_1289/m.3025 type:complete len:95 (+) Transcript_1289:481-765(+)